MLCLTCKIDKQDLIVASKAHDQNIDSLFVYAVVLQLNENVNCGILLLDVD